MSLHASARVRVADARLQACAPPPACTGREEMLGLALIRPRGPSQVSARGAVGGRAHSKTPCSLARSYGVLLGRACCTALVQTELCRSAVVSVKFSWPRVKSDHKVRSKPDYTCSCALLTRVGKVGLGSSSDHAPRVKRNTCTSFWAESKPCAGQAYEAASSVGSRHHTPRCLVDSTNKRKYKSCRRRPASRPPWELDMVP